MSFMRYIKASHVDIDAVSQAPESPGLFVPVLETFYVSEFGGGRKTTNWVPNPTPYMGQRWVLSGKDWVKA